MRTTIVILTVAVAALQSPTPYRIAQTFRLGGDGGWDYIVPDPASHRLFVGRANRVMVVDEQTGTLVGTVTGIDGAHGTAIAGATGHGFATSGNDGTVVMFDERFNTADGLAHLVPAEWLPARELASRKVTISRPRAVTTVAAQSVTARTLSRCSWS